MTLATSSIIQQAFNPGCRCSPWSTAQFSRNVAAPSRTAFPPECKHVAKRSSSPDACTTHVMHFWLLKRRPATRIFVAGAITKSVKTGVRPYNPLEPLYSAALVPETPVQQPTAATRGAERCLLLAGAPSADWRGAEARQRLLQVRRQCHRCLHLHAVHRGQQIMFAPQIAIAVCARVGEPADVASTGL